MAARASVVVPVKDGARYLEELLAAVAGQRLEGEVEVLVVDSGSRDSAATAARAVGALLARPIRGEHVSAIAPEASGKYRLVKV